MNIMGINVPDIPDTTTELCHELTIRYSLACVGQNTNFSVDSTEFGRHLQSCKSINKAPGKIATFWGGNTLLHSMIVGEDDSHWIGSNNLNSFGIQGNRKIVDVSLRLNGTDSIQTDANGSLNLKYYEPADVARYRPDVDPEPGCC